MARWPVIVVSALLVLVTAVFAVAFAVSTNSEIIERSATPEVLTRDDYAERVAVLLADADPQVGARLVEQYGCIVCHRLAADPKTAPRFEGIAERAGQRRPPLTAPDYLYESITRPAAFVVDGYSPAMPQNYPEVLAEKDIGDIIAYLLTPDAH
jgi:cytochrome c2